MVPFRSGEAVSHPFFHILTPYLADALHEALCLPEVLQIIFKNSSSNSNRNNMLVCRMWCRFAMARLWRSVDLDVFGSLTASDFVGLGILVGFSSVIARVIWS